MKLVEKIARAAEMACLLEVSAPKPGNVNRQHDFRDTHFEDFLLSAVAIRPALQTADRSAVGQIIWRAIRDTRRLITSNTNLGIVLLLAPLAKACCLSQTADLVAVREELAQILDGLSVEDAFMAYAAIRLAQAGGLGHSVQADVAEEPVITLLQAMALAQERDAIAREYVTRFAITFEIGIPAIESGWEISRNLSLAIAHGYLTILAAVPDTLIARKRGLDTALEVSKQAAYVLESGSAFSRAGKREMSELDRQLRSDGNSMNPGTTADLTTASLFLFLFLHSDLNDPLWPISFDQSAGEMMQGDF